MVDSIEQLYNKVSADVYVPLEAPITEESSETAVTPVTPQQVLASIEELENDSVGVHYPNWKSERKDRKVAFLQTSSKTFDVDEVDDKGEPLLDEGGRQVVKTVTTPGVTVHHQRLPMCQHPFVHGHEPKYRNCDACWFAFFQVNADLTESVSKVYSENGADFLTAIRGPKFTKHFKRYVNTLGTYTKAVEAAKTKEKETDVTSTGSTEGSNPEAGTVSERSE